MKRQIDAPYIFWRQSTDFSALFFDVHTLLLNMVSPSSSSSLSSSCMSQKYFLRKYKMMYVQICVLTILRNFLNFDFDYSHFDISYS